MLDSLARCSPHACVAEAFYAQLSDHPTSRTVGNPEVTDFTHRPAPVDLCEQDRFFSFSLCIYRCICTLRAVGLPLWDAGGRGMAEACRRGKCMVLCLKF